jgi:hypothetical protein
MAQKNLCCQILTQKADFNFSTLFSFQVKTFNGGGTVAGHSAHNPKIKGMNPIGGIGRETRTTMC